MPTYGDQAEPITEPGAAKTRQVPSLPSLACAPSCTFETQVPETVELSQDEQPCEATLGRSVSRLKFGTKGHVLRIPVKQASQFVSQCCRGNARGQADVRRFFPIQVDQEPPLASPPVGIPS